MNRRVVRVVIVVAVLVLIALVVIGTPMPIEIPAALLSFEFLVGAAIRRRVQLPGDLLRRLTRSSRSPPIAIR